MPTVLRKNGYRFFFFSLEGNEPSHIHVEKGDGYAKYWLGPVTLARSRGFQGKELAEMTRSVKEQQTFFEERWHEYFGS